VRALTAAILGGREIGHGDATRRIVILGAHARRRRSNGMTEGVES
jgi:hypothetical protein